MGLLLLLAEAEDAFLMAAGEEGMVVVLVFHRRESSRHHVLGYRWEGRSVAVSMQGKDVMMMGLKVLWEVATLACFFC